MTMRTLIKIASTPQLIRIATAGEGMGYNRQLPKQFLEGLDPDGKHMVTLALVHEHIAGQPVDPHMRCQMLVKSKYADEPFNCQIDMSINDYNEMDVIASPAN